MYDAGFSHSLDIFTRKHSHVWRVALGSYIHDEGVDLVNIGVVGWSDEWARKLVDITASASCAKGCTCVCCAKDVEMLAQALRSAFAAGKTEGMKSAAERKLKIQ